MDRQVLEGLGAVALSVPTVIAGIDGNWPDWALFLLCVAWCAALLYAWVLS